MTTKNNAAASVAAILQRREQMRNGVKKVIALVLTCIICITAVWGGNAAEVRAADSYKTLNLYGGQKQKVGKTAFRYVQSGSYSAPGYLYVTKNGRETLLASGTGLSSIILTNGSTVYYVSSKSSFPYTISTVYSITSNGKKKKKLFSVKDYTPISLEGYYNNKIYYGYGEMDDEKFCSYHIKKRKTQKILKNYACSIRQHNQYFYIEPYTGDLCPLLFRVHDAKTGKTKTITKGELGYNIISNKLYYAEGKYSGSKGTRLIFTISLKRCNLNGSGKKTLIKNLKVSSGVTINKNSITYCDANGMEKTKKF